MICIKFRVLFPNKYIDKVALLNNKSIANTFVIALSDSYLKLLQTYEK